MEIATYVGIFGNCVIYVIKSDRCRLPSVNESVIQLHPAVSRTVGIKASARSDIAHIV